MNIKVYPGTARGRVRPPSSKSMAHRAIICASAACGESRIGNIVMSDDISATIGAVRAMGAEVNEAEGCLEIKGRDMPDGEPFGVRCGLSGSTLRFILPFALLRSGVSSLEGQKGLLRRPMGAYRDFCERQGLFYEQLPGLIKAGGGLKAGEYSLRDIESSQFVSGLMMALACLERPSGLLFDRRPPSLPYAMMTAHVMGLFGSEANISRKGAYINGGGYRPLDLEIEGDWSQAAFWAVLGAAGGDVALEGLNEESVQGDIMIRYALNDMGALSGGLRFTEGSTFRGFSLDFTDFPDIALPMAAAATCAGSPSALYGTQRLRAKESDRESGIVGLINKMGGRAELHPSHIMIYPCRPGGGTTVSSGGDHRIAMTAGILACLAKEPTVIEGAECVSKSYPGFWRDLESLGIKTEITGEN